MQLLQAKFGYTSLLLSTYNGRTRLNSTTQNVAKYRFRVTTVI